MRLATIAPAASSSPALLPLNDIDRKVAASLQTAYWAVTRGSSATDRLDGSAASLNKAAGWASSASGAARAALDGARSLYSLGSTRRPDITSIVSQVDQAADLVQSALARNGHAYAPLLAQANTHFDTARTALAALLLAEFDHVAH